MYQLTIVVDPSPAVAPQSHYIQQSLLNKISQAYTKGMPSSQSKELTDYDSSQSTGKTKHKAYNSNIALGMKITLIKDLHSNYEATTLILP